MLHEWGVRGKHRGVSRRLPHLFVLPWITIIIIPTCRAPLIGTCQSNRYDRDIMYILVVINVFHIFM